ncbi:MAG: hypothetical protein ACRCZQ_08255, partial [Bacteroidales bacterium]
MATLHESPCKLRQIRDQPVPLVRPVKRLFEVPRLQSIVRIILRIHPVADHKQLHEMKQSPPVISKYKTDNFWQSKTDNKEKISY